MEELDLKTRLLANDAGRVGEMQRRLKSKVGELVSTKQALEAKKPALKEKIYEYGRLKLELRAARSAIGRKERVMHDLAGLICKGYTSLMRAQALSYRNRLTTLLGDAHLYGEYLGSYRFHVGEDGYSLHLDEADSNEERRRSTPQPQSDGDVLEIPPPSSVP